MFVGRKMELKQLNQQYLSHHFEFAVIYGRRRIGKTSLIQQFIQDKKSIFFTGIETSSKQNLINLSEIILNSTQASFDTFQKALEYVFELSNKEKIVFVIDEFPFLANSYPQSLQYYNY